VSSRGRRSHCQKDMMVVRDQEGMFNFLLGREKTGGDSLQVAEAGEAIIKGR
jgi:hypothetical protein